MSGGIQRKVATSPLDVGGCSEKKCCPSPGQSLIYGQPRGPPPHKLLPAGRRKGGVERQASAELGQPRRLGLGRPLEGSRPFPTPPALSPNTDELQTRPLPLPTSPPSSLFFGGGKGLSLPMACSVPQFKMEHTHTHTHLAGRSSVGGGNCHIEHTYDRDCAYRLYICRLSKKNV